MSYLVCFVFRSEILSYLVCFVFRSEILMSYLVCFVFRSELFLCCAVHLFTDFRLIILG